MGISSFFAELNQNSIWELCFRLILRNIDSWTLKWINFSHDTILFRVSLEISK